MAEENCKGILPAGDQVLAVLQGDRAKLGELPSSSFMTYSAVKQ